MGENDYRNTDALKYVWSLKQSLYNTCKDLEEGPTKLSWNPSQLLRSSQRNKKEVKEKSDWLLWSFTYFFHEWNGGSLSKNRNRKALRDTFTIWLSNILE